MAELLLVFLFFYFRIIPIINQTVPYTYDQGRDFLKAQEIILYKNPTLLGPTTGIMGLYHGVWWYYFLSVPFIMFNGWPTGFLIFILAVSFIQVFLFYLFIKKEFDPTVALIFLGLIASSPYMIGMSFFAISSILVLPFILSFLFSLYQFIKTKKNLYIFLVFLSLGFIFEAELPAGIFTIPAFLISLVLLRQTKRFFARKINFLYAFVGLIIPIAPRIVFEAIKGFPQTKVVIKYITQPTLHTPKPIMALIPDRISMFTYYLKSLFVYDGWLLAAVILLTASVGLTIGYRKINKEQRLFFNFVATTVFFLLVLSCFYKDSFWLNYYEGLTYYFALLTVFGIYGFSKKGKKFALIPAATLSIILIVNIVKFSQNLSDKKPVENVGLRSIDRTVNYLYDVNKGNRFCLRIYTPPVIPHTYNYLLSYYARIKKIPEPDQGYINDQCWYIIENDPFQFRIDQFRKDHIVPGATLIKTHRMDGNVNIELWKSPEKQR